MDISDGEEIIDELELYAAPAAGGTALTPSFFDGSSSSSSASQLPCAAPDQEPMQMASERAVAPSAPDCVLPVSAGENDRCRLASGRPKQHLPPTSSPPVNENDEETRRGATVDRSSSTNVQERYSVPTTVPLMEELDAELLELIKNYYQRRQDPRTSTDGQRFPHTRANQHVDTSLTVDEMQQQHQPNSSTANPQPFPMNRDYCPWEQPVMPASLVNPSRDEVPATATPPHPERNRVADRRHENVTRGPRGQLTSLRRRQHQSHHYSDGQDALSHVLASNTTRTSPSATHDGSTTLADSYVPRFISYSSTSFVRAYVSDMSLNMEPALIVSGLAAALNIIVVYFLRHHVLDTRDHLGLFLIGSYLVFSSYFTVYYFLERFSSSFRRIASQDKKFYIIGNLLKAGILISIMPFAAYHLLRIVLYDEFETTILQNLGCIYSIPDFVSMIVVKRMRWSTWIHHLCVVVFNYFSLMNDYREENVCRCVVVYAGFSTFAYCVNVLLASRFLGVSHAVARVLSVAALVVYALCCATNWLWQVYYLRRLILGGHDHWTVYVYMALICLVMWDDMVLNKWLLNHARSTAFVASQKMMFQQQRRTANPSQDEM